MNYIYIDSDSNKTNIAIVEDDELVEYFIEKKSKRKTLGNIYRARVENVLKGMQAAFVNIGESKNAYLHLTDVLSYRERGIEKKHSIEGLLKTGDEILVQVIKEPLGDKGAKLSANLTLTGRYIVLTPFKKGISFSKRIKDKTEIKRLKSLGEVSKKDDMGIVFRTESKSIQKKIILDEYRSLLNIYKKIEGERNFLPTPKVLYKELDLIYRVIRDNFKEKDFNIIVNSKKVYDELIEIEDSTGMSIKDSLNLDLDLNFKYNTPIQKGLTTALSKMVKLKSGGSIVIDQTEALTAIDVNTHKYIGSSSFSKTIIDTNLEAVDEIAKQLKLRNIGGIIIIDFIDMKNKKDVNKMMKRLEEAFSKDKNKPHIVDITKLGLVEVTRKKERPSLSSEILDKCPQCKGSGKVKKELIDN